MKAAELFTFQPTTPGCADQLCLIHSFDITWVFTRDVWILTMALWNRHDGWDANFNVAIEFDHLDDAADAIIDISNLGLELRFEANSGHLVVLEDGNTYMGRPVTMPE